jgi:hypothetical protein
MRSGRGLPWRSRSAADQKGRGRARPARLAALAHQGTWAYYKPLSHLYFRRYLEAGSGGRTMLRVRLFGGAEVEGDGLPIGGAAAQRKSLAVLGLLGASGDRGMSRDMILAYLWPEIEPEKAAHRLAQRLHALRRDIGVDDLFVGSCDLRLNPERIAAQDELAGLIVAGVRGVLPGSNAHT